MKKLFLLQMVIFLIGCSSTSKKKNENNVDTSLIKSFQVNEDQIIYQFYEKFGFTDLCKHSRSYFKVDSSFQLSNNWKELPISSEDLSKINKLENKVDPIKSNYFKIKYCCKNTFNDISLISKEFISTNSFNDSLNITSGYYRVDSLSYEIYKPDLNTIFHEYYYCSD